MRTSSVDKFQLSALSHWGSGSYSIVAPGDTITYAVALPVAGVGGIKTQMDGFGQSLFALQTGISTALEFLTKFGLDKSKSALQAMSTILADGSCVDAIGHGVGALLASCLDPPHLVKLFGTAGVLLVPIVVAGPIVSFFQSEWHALVDQFNGHDKYTVVITHAKVLPALGQRWGLSPSYQKGYGEVQPSTIDNGGDPTGIVDAVHWNSWGGGQATATGIAEYVGPNQIVAHATEESATVVAFNLGTCNGKLMYQAIEWYFPQHGGKFDPNNYINICTGQYVSTPAPGGWLSSPLTITPSSLGAVRVGMTLAAAQAAAGPNFDTSGDGFAYPTTLPAGYPHDFVLALGSNGVVRCVGAEIWPGWTSKSQSVTTPEGVRLGDSVQHLLAAYGSRARYEPAPRYGISTNAGYVVAESGGSLAFVVRGGVVAEIAGGVPAIGPNVCSG